MRIIENASPYQEKREYLPEHKARRIISVLHEWYKCGRDEIHGISLGGKGKAITVTMELFAKTAYPAIHDREFSENDNALMFANYVNHLAVENSDEWVAVAALWGYNLKSHVMNFVIWNSVEEVYENEIGNHAADEGA
jgi:hypothetical protein